MLSRTACLWASLLTGISVLSAQQRSSPAQTLSRLSASVTNGQSTELLRQLTDDIGSRLVGSAAYERAAQWAAEKFREAGLTNVRFEEFTLPNGWQRGPAHARVVAPGAHRASDTFDKVDPPSFRLGGVVVATTIYAIADHPNRIAPQIGQDAVRQILRTASSMPT
jgi:hypothetical protein